MDSFWLCTDATDNYLDSCTDIEIESCILDTDGHSHRYMDSMDITYRHGHWFYKDTCTLIRCFSDVDWREFVLWSGPFGFFWWWTHYNRGYHERKRRKGAALIFLSYASLLTYLCTCKLCSLIIPWNVWFLCCQSSHRLKIPFTKITIDSLLLLFSTALPVLQSLSLHGNGKPGPTTLYANPSLAWADGSTANVVPESAEYTVVLLTLPIRCELWSPAKEMKESAPTDPPYLHTCEQVKGSTIGTENVSSPPTKTGHHNIVAAIAWTTSMFSNVNDQWHT